MIGLDTNILVRLLVADDPDQTARAQRFVAARCTPEAPGFINSVVLTEFVWVLSSVYEYKRAQIASAVEMLLAGDDRVVEHHEAVRAGLDDYRSGRADVVDAMIVRINRARLRDDGDLRPRGSQAGRSRCGDVTARCAANGSGRRVSGSSRPFQRPSGAKFTQ